MPTASRPRRVAIVGAGLTGTCIALELADAGHSVVVLERADRPLTGASCNGEGKIHLGYVYSLGPPATTRAMIRGALRFAPVLERWLPRDVIAGALSDPFVYAVPRDSMVPGDAIAGHFALVERVVAEEAARGGRYIAGLEPHRRMSDAERRRLFDDEVVAAFATAERAVDPSRICAALRRVLAQVDRVELRCSTRVLAVEPDQPGHAVRVVTDIGDEAFDLVVNCAWEDRLRLDATYGLAPERPVVHRFKVGMRARLPSGTLPTVTFTSGSYGDTVQYADTAYASWYPVGLLAQDVALHPAAPAPQPDDAEARRLARDSAAGLARLMPGATRVLTHADWQVVGGWITAWGHTGIDDARSRLHSRHDIGVHAYGPYLSVDTGKLTTAPMWADDVAALVPALA